MRLSELEAEFIAVEPSGWRAVDAIGDADGVWFLCPKCFHENSGPIGTHRVVCWQPHVSQDQTPKPGRWRLVGATIDDLWLVAGSSSIAIQGGCNAHFYVRAGAIMSAEEAKY